MFVRIVFDILGWLGTVSILLAFFLNSFGVLAPGKRYQILNIVGGLGLTLNSIFYVVWPSVALNGIWALIALVALVRLVQSAKNGRFDAGR